MQCRKIFDVDEDEEYRYFYGVQVTKLKIVIDKISYYYDEISRK